jgi:uncharacterized protein (TIGR02266 family)
VTPPTSATVTAARQGREALATALLSLQTARLSESVVEQAIEHTAAASSALYSAEGAAPSDEAAASYIHSAVEYLQRAMRHVTALRERHPQLEVVTTSIARTLALLYPVLQLSLRQRRARLPAGAVSDSDARELRTIAAFPRAPAATGRFKVPTDFDGSERRVRGDKRVFIEVEIGLSTESHFYTGLSLDVSTGGVFVATYERSQPGTAVTLYFVLPDGYVVNAEGVVRWTREASGDAPPGMGVAFVNISRESLAHIADFCANRPPLYFDD